MTVSASAQRLAAMARAAMRRPNTALVRARHPLTGGATVTFALLDAPTVCVPFERTEGATEALGDALDALAERSPQCEPAKPAALVWLSYDAARSSASPRAVIDARPHGDRCPAAVFAPVYAAVTLDLATGDERWPDDPALHDALREALAIGAADHSSAVSIALRGVDGPNEHRAAVERVRAKILDGEVYLANVTRVLHATVPLTDSAVADALASRWIAADPHRGVLAHCAGVRIAAMTMELALDWDRSTGVALSAPIKGTRPRSDDPVADRRTSEALALDPKERAENAMAVDVHRNDLGRVASVGTVTVPSLCAVEAHRYVHHLASTLRAELPSATRAVDVLRAMLPVGSVTGAPKLAAMETIAEVEPERRGLYTGAIGLARADGGVSLAVVIRTLVADATGMHYGVGGGIVWDSDPAREWDEILWKLRAVGG